MNNKNEKLIMDLIHTFKALNKYRLKKFNTFNSKNDLRPSEMILLFYLDENDNSDGQGLKASRVSEILKIAPPTVTPLLNSLEKIGYIERLRDENDRRILYVKATPEGKEFVKKLKNNFKKTITELINFLGEEDAEHYIRLSKKICIFIDNNNKETEEYIDEE